MELGKINLTEDDPDVLRTSYVLGQMLRKDDDPMGARRVLEDAYAAGLWRLGESDPLMLEISHDIGVVAEELGNRHEARKAFGRVADFGPAALGEGHWAVARARAYLGQDQNHDAVRAEGTTQPQPAPSTAPEHTSPVPQQSAPIQPAYETAPLEEPTTTLPIQPARQDQRAQEEAWQEQQAQERARQGQQAQALQPYQPAYPQPQPQTWHEQQPTWASPQQALPTTYTQNAQSKRSLGIFAAIAAVLAAVIAVSALVFVLANRSGDKGDTDVPTLGGNPPTNVALKDEGSRIRVTWTDPASGKVSFLVAMAHPGEQLKPVSTLGPGQTSFVMSSLNANLNYCFAVVAVYRDNKFATSQQACTDRPTATN